MTFLTRYRLPDLTKKTKGLNSLMALLCQAPEKTCTPRRQSYWSKKENRSEYHLTDTQNFNVCHINNEKEYVKFVEDASVPHADHIFLTCKDVADQKKIAIIVELKGKDVEHGYEQIAATMKTMKTYLESYLVVARIVPTKTPKATQNARSRDMMIRLLKSQAQKVGVKVPVNTLYNNLYKESLTKLYKIFE